ncbi:MAG: hypothetical protein IJ242_01185 [Clostridia bacterium]|nr:hypothetical protein [Clostridia bacterium]
MKKRICLILIMLAALCIFTAAQAADTQIISCPEQQFSVLTDSANTWTFDSSNGVTIYTDHSGSIPYVLVFRSEDWIVDVADYVHEQYTPRIKKSYGNDLVSFKEYENYSIAGRQMQAAALYSYKLQGYIIDMLRLYDVQDGHTVVFTAKYIQGRGDKTIAALEQAVASYQPDPNYYALNGTASAPKAETVSGNTGNYVYDEGGVFFEITSMRPSLSPSYPANIRLGVHVINQSGHQINITLPNASINGVAVVGLGAYSIRNGTDKEDEFFLLKPETDAAIRAACNSKEATFDIVVTNASNHEVLGTRKNVTISLESVPSFTPYPTPNATPTAKPTAKPTVRPIATPKPATNSSSSSRSEKTFYGITSMAFSDRMWATWEKKPGDMLNIRFEVLAKTRQVKSFVLYLYAVDDWGDPIYSRNYTWQTNRQIARGVTAYSDYILLPDRSKIKTVYCGIKRVNFTEGPSEEVDDNDVEYYYWNIR